MSSRNINRPAFIPADAWDVTRRDVFRLRVTAPDGRFTDDSVGGDLEAAKREADAIRTVVSRRRPDHDFKLYRAVMWTWRELDHSECGEGERLRGRLVRPARYA